MSGRKRDIIPEFKTPEEEKDFWNKRWEEGISVRLTPAKIIHNIFELELPVEDTR